MYLYIDLEAQGDRGTIWLKINVCLLAYVPAYTN